MPNVGRDLVDLFALLESDGQALDAAEIRHPVDRLRIAVARRRPCAQHDGRASDQYTQFRRMRTGLAAGLGGLQSTLV